MPGTRELLQVRGLTKQFPGVLALDHVDFDLGPGEVHVLLGENGAGKSTFIKILAGAYRPDAGEILIQGHPVNIASPLHARQIGISTIYQELTLVPHLSVADNLFLGREPHAKRFPGVIDQKTMVRESEAILASLGIAINPLSLVRNLSLGQQQIVEIARALSTKARIIIMDEPTASLTDPEIKALFAAIHDLKKRGVSIIYISHRLQELNQIGDRVTVLRDGQRVGTLGVAETSVDVLINMMIGRDLKERFPNINSQPGDEVLRVEGLTRKGVFENVSFSLRRGEIVGMAGLVGAGRTEIARAIFGADMAEAGRVLVGGKVLKISRPQQAIAHGMALLPEDRKKAGLVLTLSVKHNISLASMDHFSPNGWIRSGEEHRGVVELVERLHIKTPSLDRQALYLSGGNQQKLVLAKWLCREASVFLFDEPTRGIDVGAKGEVYRLMAELVQRGAAVLMISSDLPEVLGMSHRVLVVRDGRIAGEFKRSEATQDAVLRCALGTDPL